jgi:hypothetical protein
LWEITYLLHKIYHYVSKSKKHKIEQRIPQMVRFSCGLVGIVFLEWIGIGLLVIQGIASTLALEALHLRCILVVYIFVQLREITFGQRHSVTQRVPEVHPAPIQPNIPSDTGKLLL